MSSDYIAYILVEKIPLNEKAISDISSLLKASLILLTRNKGNIVLETFQHSLANIKHINITCYVTSQYTMIV